MDTVSPETRSRIMAQIKGRGSELETKFFRALWKHGVRYRKHRSLFGRPDLTISKAQLVVFVDSCFWHGCRYHCRRPKSNRAFWDNKIAKNRKRDTAVNRYYRRRGWRVLRFWEHQLERDFDACVEEVQTLLGVVAEI